MVVAEMDHKKEFVIVGGSFVVGSDVKGRTKQEEKRSEVWRATVGRLRHAPTHWKKRCHMLVATQTQACYGQGTHSFRWEVDVLKKMRSEVMRTLWQRDFYSMSPLVTFALLAPPQLDPTFGPIYFGLRTTARCMRNAAFRAVIQEGFVRESWVEGPAARLRQLADETVFSDLVQGVGLSHRG